MLEQQPQAPSQPSTAERFRERITAAIGIGIVIMYFFVAAFAAYAAVSDNVASTGFQQLKDLLTFLGGLMGTVVGYYFGRVGVEKRAETAESTAQWAQTMQRTVEREAATAVAQLDVEKVAHDAAQAAKDLAEDAQEKAEQVAEVAEDAWQEAEAKVDQGKEVVGQLSNALRTARDQFNTIKEGVSQIGGGMMEEMAGGRTLGDKGAESPSIDPDKLDAMVNDMDSALQMAEQWQS